VLDEGLEDMFGDCFFFFPFEGVLVEVLCYEFAAGFLPSVELGGVVWRGQAGDEGGFAEGDGD